MNIGITMISSLIGMSFENMLVLILFLGGLIFYAINFKTGAVVNLVIFGAVFIWFYEAGYDYSKIIILFFIQFIFMSLSLYAIAKRSSNASGGFT